MDNQLNKLAMPQIKKVLKKYKDIRLLELEQPVFGGKYAVETFSNFTDGLCLEAAIDLFRKYKILCGS